MCSSDLYKGTEALKKTTAEALGVSKDIAGEAGAALKTTKAVLEDAFKFQFGGEDEKKR